MHYPWWYVPIINAPMLIAIVATLHVWVAFYAVGGGMILAYETSIAHRESNINYLAYLHSHTHFFVLITIVYGAITGVGIWWTIALASPLATQTLIHIFIFGWGMEYVFFLLEIVSAFIFYYYWNRLDPRTHTMIGWIYGISAWISLVIITGITAFQLNSGGWELSDGFWTALFNPQTIPQIIARTGGSLLLASLYIYLHASITLKNEPERRNHLIHRSVRWVMSGTILIVIGGILWFIYLPEQGKAALEAASALNVMAALVTAGTLLMIVMTYFGPYKNPGWVTPGFAIILFLGGLANVTTGEFIREAVRKPYIIDNLVLGHQIFKAQIPQLQQSGYLDGGVWTRHYVKSVAPEITTSGGNVDSKLFANLNSEQRITLGKTLFMYHCNNCHASERGVSSLTSLTRGWTDEMIKMSIVQMDKFHYFMPPWSGTEEEAGLLREYLSSITLPSPTHKENNSDRIQQVIK